MNDGKYCAGNPHGHSGHVRFLTCVEMTPEFASRTLFNKRYVLPGLVQNY